jgi:MerR family transcriptional regulator, light-induced transcriptional regulator
VKIPRNVPMYPMRTVVRMTGVEAHRIRYWETRYGMPIPTRDTQGRRLYTQDQIEIIKRIGSLADDRGLSLLAIGDLLNDQALMVGGMTTD